MCGNNSELRLFLFGLGSYVKQENQSTSRRRAVAWRGLRGLQPVDTTHPQLQPGQGGQGTASFHPNGRHPIAWSDLAAGHSENCRLYFHDDILSSHTGF